MRKEESECRFSFARFAIFSSKIPQFLYSARRRAFVVFTAKGAMERKGRGGCADRVNAELQAGDS